MYGEKEIVLSNRNNFLKKFGLKYEDCVVMEAEHKKKISFVTCRDKGKSIQTEAFITSEPGVTLFLLTGDCFPVCYYDPFKKVVALAHLGWKPTNLRLAQKVVTELVKRFESKPKDIQVFIGPGIHKESYVFKDPVQKNMKEWSHFLTELPDGNVQIDILGYIKKQLDSAGIPSGNISINPVDTYTSEEYYSYYRANITNEEDGRFATIVGLRKE